MKKINILTSLGLTTIATLPLVAFVSCSSTTAPKPEPEVEQTLEQEAAKFEKIFDVNPAMGDATAFAAAQTINAAGTPEEKMAALTKMITMPELSKGFVCNVISASVDLTTGTSLNIQMTISKGNESKNLNVKVQGLKVSTSIEAEAAKFQQSLPAKEEVKTQEASAVATEINAISDQVAKQAKIKTLVDGFPEVSQEYSIEIGNAAADKAIETRLNISITISKKAAGQETPKIVTFTITGFKESTKLLEAETAKFNTQLSIKSGIKLEAALQEINSGSTSNADKVRYLEQNVTSFPTITNGFQLEVGSATKVDGTKINVALKVIQINNKNSRNATLAITGFKEEEVVDALQAEANKFNTPLTINSSFQGTWIDVLATITNTSSSAQSKISYLRANTSNFPSISEGFEVEISKAEKLSETTLTAIFKIIQKSDQAFKVIATTITGFKPAPTDPDLEREAAKFRAPTIAKDRTIVTTDAVKRLNAITVNENKISLLKELATKVPTLSSGFTMTIGTAIAGTEDNAATMTVPITLQRESGGPTRDVTLLVTAFKVITVPIEEEVKKYEKIFESANKSMKTNEAIDFLNAPKSQADKLKALKTLVPSLPEVSPGLKMSLRRAVLNKKVATHVDVPVSISQGQSGATKTVNLTISGLIESDQSKLEAKVKKILVNADAPDSKKNQRALDVAKEIKNDQVLETFYPKKQLPDGMTYTLYEIPTGTGNTISITVRVNTTLANTKTFNHTFIILGFKSTLKEDAAKFNKSFKAKNPRQTVNQPLRLIRDLMKIPIDKMVEIDKLVVDLPQLRTVILLVDDVKVNPTTSTSLDFHLSIFDVDIRTNLYKPKDIRYGDIRYIEEQDIRNAAAENPGLTPEKVVLTVTDLIAETKQEELERLTKNIFVEKEANIEFYNAKTTAAEAAEQVVNRFMFHQYYRRIHLGKDIFYTFIGSSVDPRQTNILNVQLVINGEEGTLPVDHIVKIIFPG